jgi:hypothetical protein
MFRDSDGEFQGAVAELVLSSESFSEKDSDNPSASFGGDHGW